VSECNREASVMRMPWPTRGCWALGKGKSEIVNNKHFTLPAFEGARGGVVVKALRYKPEGRGFDSR